MATKNTTPATTTTKRARVAKPATKVCRVCGVDKPLTDYRAKASRPDGRDSICAVDARAWLANRKAQLASVAKPVAKSTTKRATKPVAKPAATKRAAKSTTTPALPAREAAARARDAKPRTSTVAK